MDTRYILNCYNTDNLIHLFQISADFVINSPVSGQCSHAIVVVGF